MKATAGSHPAARCVLLKIMKRTLRLLAPYCAVGVFWCVLGNAWLAILAYHAQILFWGLRSFSDVRRPSRKRIMFLALPTLVAGPLVYFLLPYMTHADLSSWLVDHRLSRLSLVAMIPYFGLLHPLLEQIHWGPLRESTPVAHPMFAGYHILVLYSLLTVPWLIVCFVVLTTASFIWQQMETQGNSLVLPVASHVLADLGVIVAAWLRT